MSKMMSAGEKGNLLQYDDIITSEIRVIEDSINAVSNAVEVIAKGSPMTAANSVYWNTWTMNNIDQLALRQMNIVRKHFEDKGYTITRIKENTGDQNFVWRIRW